MKKFYFMAGLPRSGTTLLTSIFNQNPDIHVSPMSPLINIMGLAYNIYQDTTVKDTSLQDDIYNVIDGVPDLMYKRYDATHIIDKQFHWTTDVPFTVIKKHFGDDIKIICPVRNVLEVLSSFNTLAENDPLNTVDMEVRKFDKTNLPMPDRRANYWMNNPLSEIRPSLEGMKKAHYSELKHNFHFIEYNDLVANPEEVVAGVYSYLGIEPFEHAFTGLQTPFKFNDVFGLKNHHTIRPEISNKGKNPEDVFLPETIKKYSGLEHWRSL
jgi:sulfotransferase